MHPLLTKIQGTPPVRLLIEHLQTCENGCSVGLEVSYCSDAAKLAPVAALAAFTATVEAFNRPPGVNPLAPKS